MRSTIKCCKDCTERKQGCHSVCEDYKREKAEWDITKAEMRKQYDLEQGLTGESITNMLKIKGKKRRQM